MSAFYSRIQPPKHTGAEEWRRLDAIEPFSYRRAIREEGSFQTSGHHLGLSSLDRIDRDTGVNGSATGTGGAVGTSVVPPRVHAARL